MRVVYTFIYKRWARRKKRRWRVCAKRLGVRARQRRFVPPTGVAAQPEEFCLTTPSRQKNQSGCHVDLFPPPHCGQTTLQYCWLAAAITVLVIFTDGDASTLVETLVQLTRLVELCIQ